jgi:hypothetical protein
MQSRIHHLLNKVKHEISHYYIDHQPEVQTAPRKTLHTSSMAIVNLLQKPGFSVCRFAADAALVDEDLTFATGLVKQWSKLAFNIWGESCGLTAFPKSFWPINDKPFSGNQRYERQLSWTRFSAFLIITEHSSL